MKDTYISVLNPIRIFTPFLTNFGLCRQDNIVIKFTHWKQ